jgi:glycine/D-amino acid oxidase-like deaminating enzyme
MNEVKAATSLGIDAYFTDKTELPFKIEGAACFRNQAMFSPLKFVNYIASELEIRENTKVLKIKGKEIITDNGNFTADKIVVATHYPIINFPGFYFLRQHQERSYVLELTGCPRIEGMYYGVDKGGLSFRQAGEALLLGGGAHRTGKRQKTGSFCFLRKKAKELFPDSNEVSAWAAQDCMPHDGIPFIGKYTIFRDDMYVITGFQKWGMTTSMIAAQIIRDAICNRENPYSKLFAPQRINVVAGLGKLLIDVFVSTKGLFCGWLGKKEKRCKHLGCRLEWNQEENSYDCPCHGSRYDKNGNILDNPTIRRIDI